MSLWMKPILCMNLRPSHTPLAMGCTSRSSSLLLPFSLPNAEPSVAYSSNM